MDAYTRTRVSLHAVAEGILAGPQYERSATIRLRPLQGGFATVAEPTLRVAGTELVTDTGARVALQGTFSEAAAKAGVTFTVPTLYGDHAPVGAHDEISVDAGAGRADRLVVRPRSPGAARRWPRRRLRCSGRSTSTSP